MIFPFSDMLMAPMTDIEKDTVVFNARPAWVWRVTATSDGELDLVSVDNLDQRAHIAR